MALQECPHQFNGAGEQQQSLTASTLAKFRRGAPSSSASTSSRRHSRSSQRGSVNVAAAEDEYEAEREDAEQNEVAHDGDDESPGDEFSGLQATLEVTAQLIIATKTL